MTADQIRSLGPALSEFPGEFSGCFRGGGTGARLRIVRIYHGGSPVPWGNVARNKR